MGDLVVMTGLEVAMGVYDGGLGVAVAAPGVDCPARRYLQLGQQP